jgi:hypothetical protein
MLDPHREIQALVDNFVADLSELAKRIAIEQVRIAFDVGGNLPPGPTGRSPAVAGPKRGARRVTVVAAKRTAGTSGGAGARRAGRGSAGVAKHPPPPAPAAVSRARRGQDEIEALRGELLAAITAQPGARTEELNAALGTTTTQIAQPLRRLVADKQVRTEGARRGMRYFAATGDAPNGRRASTAASAAATAAAEASAAEAASVAEAAAPGEPAA